MLLKLNIFYYKECSGQKWILPLKVPCFVGFVHINLTMNLLSKVRTFKRSDVVYFDHRTGASPIAGGNNLFQLFNLFYKWGKRTKSTKKEKILKNGKGGLPAVR